MLLAGSAFAQSNDDTRPGWGFGDQNHVHTGPPGQSVHPVVNVSQSSNSNFSFSGGIGVNTGNNLVNTPTNPGSIVTGAAQAVVSFVVNMGQNIFGS